MGALLLACGESGGGGGGGSGGDKGTPPAETSVVPGTECKTGYNNNAVNFDVTFPSSAPSSEIIVRTHWDDATTACTPVVVIWTAYQGPPVADLASAAWEGDWVYVRQTNTLPASQAIRVGLILDSCPGARFRDGEFRLDQAHDGTGKLLVACTKPQQPQQ